MDNCIDLATPAPVNNQNKKRSLIPILIKTDRLAAWVLLLIAIAYGITGYGMTKGLIDPSFARTLHFGLLGVIGLIAFVIHTAWAIHLALKRHCIWNGLTQTILVVFYVLVIGFFLWAQFFYQFPTANYLPIESPATSATVTPTIPTISNTPSTPAETAAPVQPNVPVAPIAPETPTSPIFTATSLKSYNGRNGQPAYIAVDGLVYDVSSLFRGGVHQGWPAGQDLSSAFHDQHSSRYLQGFAVMGTFQN